MLGVAGSTLRSVWRCSGSVRMVSDYGAQEGGVILKSRIPVSKGISCIRTHDEKTEMSIQLLAMKDSAGLSFDSMGKKLGYTNAYVAQLLLLQSPIKSKEKAELLRDMVTKNGGEISDDLLANMQRCQTRSFDNAVLEDPTCQRFMEIMQMNAEALKMVINEKFGDGVMSSTDMKLAVKKVKGNNGEERVQIILDGKFCPFVEQTTDQPE